jgi:hypothetical protein
VRPVVSRTWNGRNPVGEKHLVADVAEIRITRTKNLPADWIIASGRPIKAEMYSNDAWRCRVLVSVQERDSEWLAGDLDDRLGRGGVSKTVS